jgi:hypothetical protein
MPEHTCGLTRPEISAYIDNEADARTTARVRRHLDDCGTCSRYEDSMRSIKRAVRLQPALPVPDLHDRVMERVAAEVPLILRRRERYRLGRVAAMAATATIVFLAGTASFWRESPPEMASATEITRLVRTAARSLDTYRATYEITERGWHPSVGSREFRAKIWFDAPELFRLRVRDLTEYPSGPWPANDVDVVASPRRWSIREPSTCPTPALPECSYPGGTEVRTITQRQPFDGTTTLPTDIILPLQTLASSDRFTVLGEDEISGRPAYKLALTYADARSIIDSIQAGGSWSGFSPDSVVELWIDRDTWFPLSLTVTEPGRSAPGLEVRATSFDRSAIPRQVFHVGQDGIVKSGGFHADETVVPAHQPTYTGGLGAYRSGRTDNGSVVISYAKGMTWLKLVYSSGNEISSTQPETSERVALDGGVAYYQAADDSLRRTIDLWGGASRLRIETNMDRAELLQVARSTGFIGRPAPLAAGVEIASLDDIASLGFTALPTYLPDGYRMSAAYITSGEVRSAVLYFRRTETEYDGLGVRLTHVAGVRTLPASSETFELVRVGDSDARWSVERGELEWIDGSVYRAVAAPSLGVAEAERIARGLR